ncbi:class I SAM-dependent methyltransferase [Candidatus Saccharibacteria bacterium]|nr:class I SAM-dependent methyltransferase [Candidatus Saccharibacteria bacterium]
MSETLQLQPMHTRRPDQVNQSIDCAFRYLQSEFPSGYIHHGLGSSYEFMPATSTFELVVALRRDFDEISTLDVGAGAGGFITNSGCWRDEDVAHGISAYDYRKEMAMVEITNLTRRLNGNYFVANAETMDEIPGLLPKYNLVVSRWMLRHLIEPIGTLEQMANRVAVGGILAFDRFRWRSYEGSDAEPKTETILDGLEAGGYCIDLDFQPGMQKVLEATRDLTGVPDVIIRRTDDTNPVRFNIDPVSDEVPVGTFFPRAKYLPIC